MINVQTSFNYAYSYLDLCVHMNTDIKCGVQTCWDSPTGCLSPRCMVVGSYIWDGFLACSMLQMWHPMCVAFHLTFLHTPLWLLNEICPQSKLRCLLQEPHACDTTVECQMWAWCSKNAGLQGSTLSDHRMTTGFGPFELPTCGLLQRGRDHCTMSYSASTWGHIVVHSLLAIMFNTNCVLSKKWGWARS